MNLVSDAWLPCRLLNGSPEFRSPADALRPDVEDLTFARADLNDAAAMFLIGLAQTAVVRDPSLMPDRAAWKRIAHDSRSLQAAVSALAYAFDAASALQREVTGDPMPAGRLMPESPGDNTVEKNKDITVWREAVAPSVPWQEGFGLLVEAQLMAIAWGGGFTEGVAPHAMFCRVVPDWAGATLADRVMLNVLPYRAWCARFGKQRWNDDVIFPWRAGVPAEKVTPPTHHALAVYWGTPKAMRVTFADGHLTQWARMKHPRRFEGFEHPLVSYGRDKTGQLRAHRLRGERPGYDYWAALTLQGRPAVLAALLEDGFERPLRLAAFGWWSDQAEAMSYVSAVMPVYTVPEERREAVSDRVSNWIAMAEKSRKIVYAAARKLAEKPRLGSIYLETEAAFYDTVRQLSAAAVDDAAWKATLRRARRKLFDDFVNGARLDLVDVARERARLSGDG